MEKLNIGLSRMHYAVAGILIMDILYIWLYQQEMMAQNHGANALGFLIARAVQAGLHVYAAQRVVSGLQSAKYLSIFLSVLLLAAYPIGTVFGAVMLVLIAKWKMPQSLLMK